MVPAADAPSVARRIGLDVSSTRAGSYSRTRDILCHDPAVAAYIVVDTFVPIWASRGWVGWGRDVAKHIRGTSGSPFFFDFIFIAMGVGAFFCSLVCLR